MVLLDRVDILVTLSIALEVAEVDMEVAPAVQMGRLEVEAVMCTLLTQLLITQVVVN